MTLRQRNVKRSTRHKHQHEQQRKQKQKTSEDNAPSSSKLTDQTRNILETTHTTSNIKPPTTTPPRSPLTVKSKVIIAAVILIFTPLVIYNIYLYLNQTAPSPIEYFLSSYICHDATAHCHPHLEAVLSRRTHRASHDIASGETLLILPRNFLLWDLDALRDEFMISELPNATHESTGKPLDSGAYLAAYMVRRQLLARGEWNDTTTDTTSRYNDPLDPFFDILPSHETLSQHHPTLWPSSLLARLFGSSNRTVSSITIRAFRDMIQSEYSSFCHLSPSFFQNVPRQAYFASRVNVLSRSFGTGPPSPMEFSPHPDNPLATTINLTTGCCRAMSPILDMWDHHAHPNAQWRYDVHRRAFIVTSTKMIPRGWDVMVSYGRYTDTHLLAKFGFVNGDGSGWTEASLAVYHDLADAGLKGQFEYPFRVPPTTQMMRYMHDDGYPDCITPKDPEWNFKRAKLHHLASIAHIRSKWTIRIPPRRPDSLPGRHSHIPITETIPTSLPKQIAFNAKGVMAACRIMVLTADDLAGHADENNNDDRDNPTTRLRHASHAGERAVDDLLSRHLTPSLNYRSLRCLDRLIAEALRYYPSLPKNEAAWKEEAPFRSREWNAMHVRLGEMITLEGLRSVVRSGAKEVWEMAGKEERRRGKKGWEVRREKCPVQIDDEEE